MSRSRQHAHARDRWHNSRKRKSWCRRPHRRSQFSREVEDGIVEFDDTAIYYGRPLDYVTRDYLHVWRAREDRRHWGRHALDRTRAFVRPGSVDHMLSKLHSLCVTAFGDGAVTFKIEAPA